MQWCKPLAKTSPTSKKKSADQLFIELLQEFEIPCKISPLIEIQLAKLFTSYNADNINADKQLESQLSITQSLLKQLKIRFGLGQIDKETYELTQQHLAEQLLEINKEMNSGKVTISNLESLLSKSLKMLENISKIWGSGDLEEKRKLHKIMFPEGIFYNAQNHQYLTRNSNKFIELVSSLSAACDEKRNGNFQNFIENSRPVSGSRELSNQIVQDLISFYSIL
jgi:site-specific DNA recombinase